MLLEVKAVFEVFRDGFHRVWWRLVDEDGVELLRSPRSFLRVRDAVRAVGEVRVAAGPSAEVVDLTVLPRFTEGGVVDGSGSGEVMLEAGEQVLTPDQIAGLDDGEAG